MGVTNKMGFSTNLDFNKILEVYRNGTDSLNYGDGTVIVPNGKTIKKKSKKKATTALPYSAPQQNTYSDYRQSDSSPEIISFLDLFKTDLIDIFKESRKSDDDRNTKLDEIILRLDLQGSGLDVIQALFHLNRELRIFLNLLEEYLAEFIIKLNL